MNIVAYAFNAAVHCVKCTGYRFGATAQGWHSQDENNIRNNARDREGNPVRPVFSTDESSDGYCDTCGMAYGDAPKVARVLTIDAWREDGGWTWNNWRARGFVPLEWCDLKPRALLRKLRERGDLPLPAPGRAAIDDDGHNIVVYMRGTGEPIVAIEYGSVA